MDRLDSLESSLSSSSSSSSSKDLLRPAMQCVTGSSSPDEMNRKLLQTSDIVEENTIGKVTIRAPFKEGESGMEKILHDLYKAKDKSTQVIVRRDSAEFAKIQACVVPNESIASRQFDDRNYAVEFVDRPENECLIVQGRTSVDVIHPHALPMTLRQLLRNLFINIIFVVINIYYYLLQLATSFTCHHNQVLKSASRICCPPTSSSIVVKLDSTVLDQEIYNLKRECEEKDATIKELSSSIRSLEVFGSKRFGELEDIIRRKNMIIRKLKKDMMLLEQKVVNRTSSPHPSICTAMSSERQLPTMADNILYYMDSPSSSESESPSENQPEPIATNQQLPLSEKQGSVQEARKMGKGRNIDHLVKPTNSAQEFQTSSPLKEKSLNVTTNVDSGSRRMTTSSFSDSRKSKRRASARPMDLSTQKRWV